MKVRTVLTGVVVYLMVVLFSSQASAWEKRLTIVNETNSTAIVQLGHIPYSGNFASIPAHSEGYVELAPEDEGKFYLNLTGHFIIDPPLTITQKLITPMSCACQSIAYREFSHEYRFKCCREQSLNDSDDAGE